jgi:2,5-furandicarboxylate decarboxylase 1
VTADLRQFLQSVETRSGYFERINGKVDPRWELSAVQKRLEMDGALPVLLFEQVAGSQMRVVSNLFARKRYVGLAIGAPVGQLAQHISQAWQRPIPSVTVTAGPAQEVVRESDQVDLRTLPLVTHCEKDAGPYLTSGVTIMRDPDSGLLNAGMYRSQYLSPTTCTMNLSPVSHGTEIANAAEARGAHVEAAIIIGHHPALAVATQRHGVPGEFELDIMGALTGAPVEMVQARTVDVLVPARAEIVIEGRIRTDLWADDGPFGDFAFYYSKVKKARVFEVTAITHRHDAIFHDLFSAGREHPLLYSLGRETAAFNELAPKIPGLRSVSVSVAGAGHLLYLRIHKKEENQGLEAARAGLATGKFIGVVVVDEDVDIEDDRQVVWALMTRARAEASLVTMPGPNITHAGIDATRTLDASFPEYAQPPRELWSKLQLSRFLK